MSRTLEAWINDRFVGTLHEANGFCAFEYSKQWLAHPDAYPLCPGIPLVEGLQRDGATSRPVQWYFDDLLPEEGQRTLLAGNPQRNHATARKLSLESSSSLWLTRIGEAIRDRSDLRQLSPEVEIGLVSSSDANDHPYP